MQAYVPVNGRLARLTPAGLIPPGPPPAGSGRLLHDDGPREEIRREALEQALWIDLYQPSPAQTAAVEALGIEVPTLADMEEIEISNRLYRETGVDYMTVVLPGLTGNKVPHSGPVTFILTPTRLVTVRHHAPRPFETYPERADKSGPGCDTPEKVFLGLIDEITGRLADILEGVGRSLDEIAASVFRPDPTKTAGKRESEMLRHALEHAGQQGDILGRVRLSLLTLERAISFFGLAQVGRSEVGLKSVVKSLTRDLQALEVHADFLGQRLALATDATMGMINLAQNATVRILSVVAALFLPPTLIASIYGMNFSNMPELDSAWGYPAALLLMLATSVGTFLILKWKRWL